MTETRSRMARKKMSLQFGNCNGDVQMEATRENKHVRVGGAGKSPTSLCGTNSVDKLSWFISMKPNSTRQEKTETSDNGYDTHDSDEGISKSDGSTSSEDTLNGTNLVNGIKPHSFYSRHNQGREMNSVRKQLIWKNKLRTSAKEQDSNLSKNMQSKRGTKGVKRKQDKVSSAVMHVKKRRNAEKCSRTNLSDKRNGAVVQQRHAQSPSVKAAVDHELYNGMENKGQGHSGDKAVSLPEGPSSFDELFNGHLSHHSLSNGHAQATDVESVCSVESITSGPTASSGDVWQNGTGHSYSAGSGSDFEFTGSSEVEEPCKDTVNEGSETFPDPELVKTPQKQVFFFPSPSSSSKGSSSPSEDCKKMLNTPRSSPENQASITKYFKSLSGAVLESRKSTPQNGTASHATPTVGSGKGLKTRSPRSRKANDKKQLEQMYLDLGQKDFGHVTCQTCGMVYTKAQPDDEADHIKHHRRFVSGLRFMGWKNERVAQEFHDGRVIMVNPDDNTLHTKKVVEIRKVVDAELGFASEPPFRRQESKTFLFISNKRVVGCAVAIQIDKGYPVLPNNNKDTTPERQLAAWCCSSTPQPAQCGISRIWVFRPHRRNKVATRLLDSVRTNFIYGCVIPKDMLAFSDPTPDGKRLAQSYAGTSQFLVFR